MTQRIRFAILLGCLWLTACGGGGGGDEGPPPPNTISLNVTRAELAVPGENSPAGTFQDVMVTFSGASVAVTGTTGATPPNWLVIDPVTLSPTTARVRIIFVPANVQPSTPQRVSTTLRFTTSNANGGNAATQDLEVTATIDHRLVVAPDHFMSTQGAASSSTTVELATLNASWAATSDAPWLTVAPASGTGHEFLTLTANPATLGEGDHQANLTIRDTLTNRATPYTVRITVDSRRLELGRQGVALSSTLGRSRPNAAIRVIDTAGLAGRWVLSDDAAWLTTSATSGAGTSEVTLNADAAGLADGMHYATVTVSPDNEPGFVESANVNMRVGFFVDHTTPITSPASFTGMAIPDFGSRNLVDPIRPYLYELDDAIVPVTLKAWNMHTGALEYSLPVPGAPRAASLHVSPDGALLLVGSVPITLPDGAPLVGAPWPPANRSGGASAIARVGGINVLLAGRQMFSTSDGSLLAEMSLPSHMHNLYSIAISPNGRRAVILSNSTIIGHYVIPVMLKLRAGAFSAHVPTYFGDPNNPETVYFDRDGDHFIVETGTSLERLSFLRSRPDVATRKAGYGPLFPSAYSGYYDSNRTSGVDQWLHFDGNLNVIASARLDQIGNKTLSAISSDETRLMAFEGSAPGPAPVVMDLDF
jgi:hypothetical protein